MPTDPPPDPRSIFGRALGITDPAERAAYLDAACPSPAARAEVAELLEAHDRAGGFLEQPAALGADPGTRSFAPADDATADHHSGPAEHVGAVVAGRYKLVEALGEGGMGTVYMAQQTEPVKRLVALKVIKAGMDSKAVLARFEAERQALALMDHPNIAKVLDAGTTESGRPFFVMELVKGVPITTFCDQRKLTPRERLELFVPVCQAIQHAHTKGVIHRDIKPSNVLVALYDGVPVPKVIDFGVAKAAGQPLTDRTLVTGFGAVVGTPEYMSPEQAELNQLDIDTRSDVFALGVVLYELLTGTTPLDRARIGRAALLEVLRIVREEEPPKPSTRISTSAALAGIAASRGTDPARLSRLVRGELDWIVMKSLEKDRNRRYDTPTALAKDVERYLAGDAVEACPPTLGYRLRKLYRRNRAAVLLGAAFGSVLLAVVASLAYGLSEAGKKAELRGALDRADVARADAEQAREMLARSEYGRTIGLSYREYLAGHHEWGQELLDTCGERYRGWEWHLLARKYHPEEVYLSHDASVGSATFNPEGTLVATASGGAIRFWDTTTGRLIRTIDPKGDQVAGPVVFTPDGSGLVAAHFQSARIWRVSDGTELLRLPHADTVFAVAINHAGTRVATSCQDRIVRVWDASTGKELLAVDRYKRSGGSIEFSRDGRALVFGNGADPLAVIDATNGSELFKLSASSAYARVPRFSPDGTQLAFSAGTHVNGYELGSSNQKQTVWLDGGREKIGDLVWTHRGDRIVTVDDQGTIRLWDVKGREQVASFRGHAGSVSSVALSRDGTLLVTGSGDGTARIWNVKRLPRKHILRPRTGIRALALSPNGGRAVVGGNGEVQAWDLATGERLWTRKHGAKWVTGVAFGPDGRRVVSAGDDHTIVLWDATDGTRLAETRIDGAELRFVAFHPNGSAVATNGPGETLQLFTADSLEPLRAVRHPAGPVWSAAFSADGRRFATSAQGDDTLRIWDTASWTLTGEIDGQATTLTSLCFSADGSRLAGRASGGVLVFDVPTGRRIQTLPCPRLSGESLALSPDGTRVAASGRSGEVHIWEVGSASELLRLAFPESVLLLNTEPSDAFPIVFSCDGTVLVTGAFDQSIRVWDGTPLARRAAGVPTGNKRK